MRRTMEQRLSSIGVSVHVTDIEADDYNILHAFDQAEQPAGDKESTVLELLRIPPDSTPFQKIKLQVEKEKGIEEIFFQPIFKLNPESEKVDITLLQKQAEESREAGCTTYVCPHVSPNTLLKAAEEGTIQCVDLKETCLCLYWDESAHLKQRTFNTRATQLLQETEPNDKIHGDAFLMRK